MTMDYDDWAESERDRISREDAEFAEAWEEYIRQVQQELADEFDQLIVSMEDEPSVEIVDLLTSGPVIRTEKLQTVVTDLVTRPEVAKTLMDALALPWNKHLRSVIREAYVSENAEHIAKVRGLPSNDL